MDRKLKQHTPERKCGSPFFSDKVLETTDTVAFAPTVRGFALLPVVGEDLNSFIQIQVSIPKFYLSTEEL